MHRVRPLRLLSVLAALLAGALLTSPAPLAAQAGGVAPAPERAEGEGPFQRLILRGGILVDGTGAPPLGPVDVVIEGDRIVNVVPVGSPGLPIDPDGRPPLTDEVDEGTDDGTDRPAGATRELDVSGMYVLPGFIDMHGHQGGAAQGTPAEYVYKLWMGHGITTVRDPGCGNGLDWCLREKERSEGNEITAPRIEAYAFFGMGHDGPFTTPGQAEEWVRSVADQGIDGIKLFGYRPDIMQAAIEEANERGLRSACHHAQLAVTRVDVLDTARWGLTSMEHWYGLPEALFDDRVVQDYPVDYNYLDESHRFGQAGRLWEQAAEPGSDRWNGVMDELLELDFTLDPTFTIYEASRDLMRARRAEWHEEYTLPSLWDFFAPSREAHGSYWFDWSTADEIAWRRNFARWMEFVDEYKNRGGRVTAGSDSGYIYKLYGFGYVEELELLQEAGFHPLEVIRAATLSGAEAMGRDHEIGSVEPGKLADLIVVPENPLANFKVLLGTGHIRVTPENEVVRVGGVRWTIKDGIVYDAPALLDDVREMVRAAKEEAGRPELYQPGLGSESAPEDSPAP